MRWPLFVFLLVVVICSQVYVATIDEAKERKEIGRWLWSVIVGVPLVFWT